MSVVRKERKWLMASVLILMNVVIKMAGALEAVSIRMGVIIVLVKKATVS